MPFSPENENDAGFYQLVHQLAGPKNPEDDERRGQPRHAFPASQCIAPRRNAYVPPQNEFFEVQCHDLNSGGFSFLLEEKPDYDELVVSLGEPPEPIYLIARVTHCSRVIVYPSGLVEPLGDRATHVSYRSPDGELGRLMFRVGCRFTKRLTDRQR